MMVRLILLLVMAVPFLQPQSHSFESYQGPYGANIRSLAATTTGYAFAGTFQAGLFRSSDAGQTWVPSSDGLTEMTVFAIHILSDNIVLAGTSMEKVFRTTDRGAHWTEYSSLIPQGLNGVPYSSVTGFAAAPNGTLYAASAQHGVFMSTNLGGTWLRMGGATSSQFIATNSLGYVYAVSSSKLYRSFGDSTSWTELPIGQVGLISSMTVAPDNSVIISVSGSVYRSTDHGGQWAKIYTGTSSNSIRPIAVMQDGAIMFASRNFIYRSTDNGSNWTQRSLHSSSGTTSFGIADAGAGIILAANNVGGTYRSPDAGNTWSLSNNGLTANRIQRSVMLKDGTIYVLMGLRELFYRLPNSLQWTNIPSHTLPSGFNDIAVTSGNILLLGTLKGVYRTSDRGETWAATDTINLPHAVTALTIDTLTNTVYALTSSNGLYRSTNLGATWSLRSSSASINNAQFLRRAPSGTLFAGVNQQVYRSTDLGATWGEAFIIENASVSDMDFTPSGTVLLLVGNTLFRSTNDGLTYSNVANGSIIGGTVLRTLGENKLIAGSTTGVKRSTNGGVSWKTFSAGLLNASILSLNVSIDGHLLVGTYAGMWKSIASEMNYSFDKDSLVFGAVRVGTTAKDSIVLRNSSSVPLSIISITSTDTSFVPFRGSFTVAAHDSAAIPVKFTPMHRRWYASALIITTSEGPDTLRLSGRGKGGVLALGNNRLTFPNTLSGLQSHTLTVSVLNSGDDSLMVSHTISSDSAYSAKPTAFTLLPNQLVYQQITFAPKTPGKYSALLRYHSNALPPVDSIVLEGNGYLRALPQFHVSTLMFGRVQIDSQRSLLVLISNAGNDTLRIVREDTLDDLIPYHRTQFSVPPQDTISDSVTVRPAAFGLHATYAKYFIVNDSSRRFIPVYATGYALSKASYSFTTIDAGIRPVGIPIDTVITITNIGTDTLRIVSRQLYPENVSMGLSIPPGRSVQDTLTITPIQFGTLQAFFRYHTNAYDTPDTIRIAVFGRGSPSIQFSPSTGLTFANVESSKTKALPLMIFNDGEDTLKIFSSTSTDPRFTSSVKPVFLLPHHSWISDTIRFTAHRAGTDTAFIVYQTNTPAGVESLMVIGVSTGGSYWMLKNSFFETPLLAFTMALNGTMVAATNRGFFYSTDAGERWQKGSIADTMTQVSNFVLLPDGVLLASSYKQGLLRSADNGITWKKLQSPVITTRIHSVVQTADGSLLALQQSDAGLVPKFISSTDNGNTWTAHQSQLKNPSYFSSLFATGSGPLFLMDHTVAEVRLIRSVNDGITWNPVGSPPNPKLTRIYREGRRGRLYASMYSGGVAVSSDTGSTWTTIYSGGLVTDIFETKDSVLYISVYGQSIKRSVNNGITWTDLPNMGNVFMVPFIRHYNGTLWWGHEYGLFASRNSITGRFAVETVPSPVRTRPVEISKSSQIALPLFNNTTDTITHIDRQVSHPWFSFTHTSGAIAPNTALIDSLIFTPQKVSAAETCAVRYQTSAGSVTAYIIGRGVIPMEVDHDGIHSLSFTLEQNFPNPFNPNTTIGFSVPKSGRVLLRIFNAIGQLVAVPVDAELSTGTYSVVWSAEHRSSGVYFYRLTAGNYSETKRMMLMK